MEIQTSTYHGIMEFPWSGSYGLHHRNINLDRYEYATQLEYRSTNANVDDLVRFILSNWTKVRTESNAYDYNTYIEMLTDYMEDYKEASDIHCDQLTFDGSSMEYIPSGLTPCTSGSCYYQDMVTRETSGYSLRNAMFMRLPLTQLEDVNDYWNRQLLFFLAKLK